MRKAVVLLVLALLGGCSPDSDSTSADAGERLDTWEKRGPANYTWTLEASEPVFGPHWTRVRVEEGRPVHAIADGEPVAIEGSMADDMPATVDALIDWLIRYGDDAKAVHVRCDERLGYPTLINLDHSDAIDDEVSFRLVAFEAT